MPERSNGAVSKIVVQVPVPWVRIPPPPPRLVASIELQCHNCAMFLWMIPIMGETEPVMYIEKPVSEEVQWIERKNLLLDRVESGLTRGIPLFYAFLELDITIAEIFKEPYSRDKTQLNLQTLELIKKICEALTAGMPKRITQAHGDLISRLTEAKLSRLVHRRLGYWTQELDYLEMLAIVRNMYMHLRSEMVMYNSKVMKRMHNVRRLLNELR